MASPAWILPLVIIAPIVFMWSNNWYMYSLREFFVSFLILILTCSVVFIIGDFVYSKFESKVSGRLKYLCCFIFCIFFVKILLIFLELPLRGFFALEYFKTKLIIINFIAASFLLFIITKGGFKLIKFFLIFWMFLSIGTGLYNTVSAWLNEEKILNEDEHIILTERSNIYLFILESYHDLDTMRHVYGIDSEPLRSHVLSRGFFIYENVYSNSIHTLASMSDIFGMKLGIAQEVGLDDVFAPVRELIGGGRGNQVYRILKENGYHTTYLTTEAPFYYFHTKGAYLDETDVDFGFNFIFSMRPICELVPILSNCRYCHARNYIKSEFRNKLSDNIRMIIEEYNDKIPLFIGFKSGAIHTDSVKHSWKQKDDWVFGGNYQRGVSSGNQEIFEIVDLIVDKDPSAVIVLIGDHGARRLRNIQKDAERQGQGIANLDAFLKQNGESLDTLVSDTFGTFLAIRMPGKGDISNGLPMSHVNIFRHIFAALADNSDPGISRAILQRRAPSESTLGGIKLVKDGIVQRPPEQ